MFLAETYPLTLLEDGRLLLYDYVRREDGASQPAWIAWVFYLHFFPVWLTSFSVMWVVLITSWRRPLVLLAYAAVLWWLYNPLRRSPRIIWKLQMLYFFEIPRYYQEASFLIEYPPDHPQLKAVLELFEKVKWRENPRRKGRREKQIWLPPRLIHSLSKVAPYDPCYIWCCAPHGFTSSGWGQLSMCPLFNNVQNCVSTALYWLGHTIIFYTALLGNPHPAGSKAIDCTLRQRRSISIVVGGFEEATIMSRYHDRLWLRNRFGIFKKSIDHCSPIVPYFTFGESRSFTNIQGLFPLRLWLNRFSVPTCWCVGDFLWLPHNDMLHIVVGRRITPQDGESVVKLKARYVDAVQKLHQQYGPLYYGARYAPLDVW